MSETVQTTYKLLFELRLLHHYWLDEGATVFDRIVPQDKRDRRLLTYDMRSFLSISPTTGSVSKIFSLGGLFKETASGCVVAVPDNAVVPANTNLDFAIRVLDQKFYDYTAFTLRPRNIYELHHQPENKTYRYKENVPVLSNLTGTKRGSGPARILYLSREFPTLAADDQVESLVLAGGALMQLTSDQPAAVTQQINAQASASPVFVHQGDIPETVTPAGVAGAPRRGILLTEDIPDDVFCLLRLSATHPSDADFSFIDGSGRVKSPHPVFQIRLKNRSTRRSYIDNKTGASSSEPSPLPLTRFGNAGTRQKPSEGHVKAIKIGARITSIVSEIFV